MGPDPLRDDRGMATFQCLRLDTVGKLPAVPGTEGVLSKYLPSGHKFHQTRCRVLQVPAWNTRGWGRRAGPCGDWLIVSEFRLAGGRAELRAALDYF